MHLIHCEFGVYKSIDLIDSNRIVYMLIEIDQIMRIYFSVSFSLHLRTSFFISFFLSVFFFWVSSQTRKIELICVYIESTFDLWKTSKCFYHNTLFPSTYFFIWGLGKRNVTAFLFVRTVFFTLSIDLN